MQLYVYTVSLEVATWLYLVNNFDETLPQIPLIWRTQLQIENNQRCLFSCMHVCLFYIIRFLVR